MQIVLEFMTNNKETIDLIVKILGFLIGSGSLAGVIGWIVKREWLRRQRTEVNVFQVIVQPNELLPTLYGTGGDASPLADHNIIYQPRDDAIDIQSHLRKTIKKRRYILLTAPAGYGKTREAAVLAQGLMAEGYRVVRILPGWLDEPKNLPDKLLNNRFRIILFLDDLTGLFRSGEYIKSPLEDKIPFSAPASYHERLIRVIDSFETMCGENEVLVIGTARSEAGEWAKLKFSASDGLWGRFGKPFELPQPTQKAMISLMKICALNSGLDASLESLEAIAKRNQGTFRNIVQNFQRFHKEEVAYIAEDAFIPTLSGTWQEDYEILQENFPAICYIYEAIEILKGIQVTLFIDLVQELAVLFWGGNNIERLFRQRKICEGIKFLIHDKKAIPHSQGVLLPYDGQIENRGASIRWDLFAADLVNLILKYSKKYQDSLVESMISYAKILQKLGESEKAMLINAKILQVLNKEELASKEPCNSLK